MATKRVIRRGRAAVFPIAMKKPKTKPEAISDRTKTVAAAVWGIYPDMQPVGLARKQKHLIELEAVLAMVSELDLMRMIRTLRTDKYRRDWVASFERIAEELPRIRLALTDESARLVSQFTQQWLKDKYERTRA